VYINCKTYYSLRYGTFSTEELVQTAVERGVTSLALTNINTTADLWDFVKQCREAGIKPITGVEFRNGDQLLYILLAANNKGLQWINEFLSQHLTCKIPFPEVEKNPLFFNDPGDGFVIYPLNAKPFDGLRQNERIGVLPWEPNKLFTLDWKNHQDKLIVRHAVTIKNKNRFELHRLMRAIAHNSLITKLPEEAVADEREVFAAPNRIISAFKNHPFIITNTYKLMDACSIEMDFQQDKTKRIFGASEEDDRILLSKLAYDGLLRRYKKNNKAAKERVEKELKIINDLGFNAYFHINNDIVNYANSRKFYHVGRGSGANSIVAYCLGITEVDPIELNLYFERFLNPERTSPPDFDIDFSHKDRDEVFDYIFKRYGKDYVAICGLYTCFKEDSVIREIGKCYGLPDEEIKALQKTWTPMDEKQQEIIRYGNMLLGYPNIQSIHPCGMIITEKKLSEYVSTFLPPKDFTGAQIDMYTAEDIGLNKFDILSQRGLSHIKECEQLVLENQGIEVDIQAFEKFRHDETIKKQIREANTIGCFYIESPAMRQLLKKLHCDDYHTLVAASSIIRPGVAQSGMMREYIHRYHYRDQIKYLHPVFEEHLSETFGVMVFQEDVIKIAHHFAGLSLGDADILRRTMSNKLRKNNGFKLMYAKYMDGCKQKGHHEDLAKEVWRQMESFAGYSFCKAHSASFARESYMSLYLKTYYPLEFMVAVINNFGGFYHTEVYFFELLKSKATIINPCVNRSDDLTSIEGTTVHVGLVHIKGLHKKLKEKILEEREQNGPYLHLQDFIERTNAGIEQINKLISVGAFAFTGKTKKRLLWEANFLQKQNQPQLHANPVLFGDEAVEFELPELMDHPIDDLYDELELMGFTLKNPFDLVDDDPDKYVTEKELPQHMDKIVTCLTYFVVRKEVITKNNDEMYFGTFMDRNLDWIDTVHFPDVARKFPIYTNGFYRITGKVVSDFGACSIEVHKMIKVDYKHRKYANLG
jgi:DNA-directed DNA polymerase III PolC